MNDLDDELYFAEAERNRLLGEEPTVSTYIVGRLYTITADSQEEAVEKFHNEDYGYSLRDPNVLVEVNQ